NFRAIEVQAAFGNCQLDRLEKMNFVRNRNRAKLIAALESHPKWNHQFSFPAASAGTIPAWFGLVCVLDERLISHYTDYLRYLVAHGIENRPVISGNFTR